MNYYLLLNKSNLNTLINNLVPRYSLQQGCSMFKEDHENLMARDALGVNEKFFSIFKKIGS